MMLIYNKSPLSIGWVATAYGDDYRDFIAQHAELGFLEVQSSEISAETHRLVVQDGVVGLLELPAFDIALPTTAQVGATLEIANVPLGAAIATDDLAGTMDDSGVLELTFSHPGPYRIRFTHSDYQPMEATVEVTI